VLVAFNGHACPVTGIQTATSLTALVASSIFLVVARTPRFAVIGAFVAPLALMAVLASRFFGGAAPEPAATTQAHLVLLPIHVTAVLLASALFSVASALSATYLVQESRLKAKLPLEKLSQLPSLEILDRIANAYTVAGFPLLTIGVATGLFWIGRPEHPGSLANMRQAVGLIAWVQLALVLLLRSIAGWRGRRAAWGTIAGFGAAFAVFGLYLLRSAKVLP
jgi:ABC-type uncharacterized transport system permease subunit